MLICSSPLLVIGPINRVMCNISLRTLIFIVHNCDNHHNGGYHMERGGMPIHDAVGIICKKGATTENQGSGVKYMV